jgi:hypothetical protein
MHKIYINFLLLHWSCFAPYWIFWISYS